MEIVSYLLFPLIAFGLAVVVVLVGMLALSAVSHRIETTERWLPVLLVIIAGMLSLASGILNSRNLQLANLGAGFVETEPSLAYHWISRLGNLAVVCLCLPYFVAKLIPARNGGRLPVSLPVAAIAFFGASNFLLPGLFGTVTAIDHRLFYPILTIIAIYSATRNGVAPVLRALKWFLFLFLVASLLFIFVNSSKVLAPGYKAWIPGLSFRFWGLAPHANAIGPMAVLLIFIELLTPERRKLIGYLMFAVAATVLILSQSKTSVGAALAGLSVIAYIRMGDMGSVVKHRQLHWGQLGILGIAILTSVLLLALSFGGFLDTATSRLQGSAITNSVQTMSGRDLVWEAAYREFLNSPIFGYGPTLWDIDYRTSIGLNYAYHAHNQALQSLAEAGVIGTIGLIVFVALTIIYAVRASVPTRGASIAILMLFLMRTVTEVPLRPAGLGNGEMLLLIALICVWRLGHHQHVSLATSVPRAEAP